MDALATIVSDLDREIAREKRGFTVHALIYWIVVPALWMVWLFTQAHAGIVPWPLFATLGWGFGLMGHFFGMHRKVKQLLAERDDVLLAPAPQLEIPLAEAESDDLLARAEALLQRERAG